jgi:hypothetical protein
MFDCELSEKIIQHTKWLCSQTNYGNRGEFDGDKNQQLIGIAGQCVVAELLDNELPQPSKTHDGGVDLYYYGLTIDVKTMGRTTEPKPHYVNNVVGMQIDYDVDIYVFCSFNKQNKILTICGWVTKQELLENASFYPNGSIRTRTDGTTFETKADLYEIANDKLNPVNSIEDLQDSLYLRSVRGI